MHNFVMFYEVLFFFFFLKKATTEPENDPKKCPVSNKGCIFDDKVEGTDCLNGGNAACLAVGADYCSAVFGDPPTRVCCNITDITRIKAHPDVRGCPPSNQGCIFDDLIHGADCTTGGNEDCFASGGDYCSAWFGYPLRRVCCKIADSEEVKLTSEDKHGCPDSMSGCMFDDFLNGADCSANGNKNCVKAGSDYCSGWVRGPNNRARRLCCDISGDIPFGPSKADGSLACPMSTKGCIYDDIVNGADCTIGGNAACIAAHSDYCSGFHGSPPKRVCCDISRNSQTAAALEKYEKTCPVKTSGCIYDDEVEGTPCTDGGNPTCRAVGADYCSAVFGDPPQRVCCRISGVSKFQQSNPDVRGCPPSNFGCIFDDNVNGADCAIGGNDDCFAVGSDYCSAWFGHPPQRVCCDMARDTRTSKFKGIYEETCPVSTMGCIFDDDVHGADCSVNGNEDCIKNGSDYCSAWIGNPPKRFCCSISGPGPAPSTEDGSQACPMSNKGCIYDDLVDGTDCTIGGNEACIAAGSSYCSAFIGNPPHRICCTISGKVDLVFYLILSMTIAAIVLFVLLTVFFIWYQINKNKQAALLWRVHMYQLHKYEGHDGSSTTRGSMNSVSSAGSKLSDVTTISKQAKRIKLLYDIYIFKGAPVGVQKHHASAMNDHDRKELVVMRELSHDNVNPFLGLCIEGIQVLAIWRLCPKGCLLDLFEMDTLKLDWFFKYSLIRDITEGLDFLARSQLKHHGNLSSKTCLLDNRWQLKLSDYGLFSLRKGAKKNVPDQLWSPPEVLRGDNIKGTGIEQDIYAVGIITSEILTRAECFSSVEATPEELVYRIRKGENPPYRPQVNLASDSDINPTMLQIMKDCWEEDPSNRPNLRTLRHSLKNMMRGKSNNLMDHVMQMMEEYAGTLEAEVHERTRELAEEKKKADIMLYRMLPRSVVEKMKSGQSVDPQIHDNVSILCSDVVGFTALASHSTPRQVVMLLNEMYNVCDSIIDQYDVYKVETSTDGYLCVSGLPLPNGDDHAKHIADLSLSLRKTITEMRITHKPKEKMKVRIGIHTGAVIAGVVGMTMPRYCLFGEAILTAARMESSGKANFIQISETSNRYLTKTIGGYMTKPRGEVLLKGVGVRNTHWLLGKDNGFGEDGDDEDETQQMIEDSVIDPDTFVTTDDRIATVPVSLKGQFVRGQKIQFAKVYDREIDSVDGIQVISAICHQTFQIQQITVILDHRPEYIFPMWKWVGGNTATMGSFMKSYQNDREFDVMYILSMEIGPNKYDGATFRQMQLYSNFIGEKNSTQPFQMTQWDFTLNVNQNYSWTMVGRYIASLASPAHGQKLSLKHELGNPIQEKT